MSIRVKPTMSYTPERVPKTPPRTPPNNSQPSSDVKRRATPLTQTPDRSQDESAYWKSKAMENQALINEMNRLSSVLNQHQRDEHFKDPNNVQKFMRNTDETMNNYHQTQLEEIAFLKDKLARLEREKAFDEDEKVTRMQTNFLKQKIKELEITIQDQRVQIDALTNRGTPTANDSEIRRNYEVQLSNAQRENERLYHQLREYEVQKRQHQVADKACMTESRANPQLENRIKELERQRNSDAVKHHQEIDDLKQYYEDMLRQQKTRTYDSWTIEQTEYRFEIEKQRLIDDYELRLRGQGPEILEIQNRIRDMEATHVHNQRELQYLKQENDRLQNDPEKAEMVKLLQQAQSLCRDLDKEKSRLQLQVEQLQVVDELQDQQEYRPSLPQSSQQDRIYIQNLEQEKKYLESQVEELKSEQMSHLKRRSNGIFDKPQVDPQELELLRGKCGRLEREKSELLAAMQDQRLASPVIREKSIMAPGVQEDVWKTKYNKLEKQREMESKIKDENISQLKNALEQQIQQLKNSYEAQLNNMRQVTDSKMKENEDLRHFNAVLAQQLNQQILRFQQQILEIEQSRQQQPAQNPQYLLTINDLSAQVQNLQHLLQLKCMECDQLKSHFYIQK